MEPRRTKLACTTCRRKKTKCDGRKPKCSPCDTFNLPCTFPGTVRHPRPPNEHVYRELEERIGLMERNLQVRGVSDKLNQEFLADPMDDPSFNSRAPSSCNRPDDEGSWDSISRVPPTMPTTEESPSDDQTSYVLTAQNGRMQFFGTSSGLSLVSPLGAWWVENQTGSERCRNAGMNGVQQWQLHNWIPNILQDGFEKRTSQPLPPKEIARQLMSEYFNSYNKALPLFTESRLDKLLQRQYSWNPESSSSWWAAFNVILGLSYKARAQKAIDGSEDWKKSFGHIRNALNVVVELLMRAADILAVQGLLGLAMFFHETPDPQPLFTFAAAAMRLAQSIGLHRSHTYGLDHAEIEERNRTFWIAFIVDADICHKTGRPAAQDTNDFNTVLPTELPHDGLGLVQLDGIEVNYLRAYARFSLLQRDIYCRLYTTTATQKSGQDLIKEVKDCEAALLDWKKCIPIELQPQPKFSAGQNFFYQCILRLHFAYHCCYAQLHQICLHAKRLIEVEMIGNASPNSIPEMEHCISGSLTAARSAVDLLEHVEKFGLSFTWSVVYFPAAVVATLFAHILTHPHQDTTADIYLIHQVVQFLKNITAQEQGTYVDYLVSLCSDFEGAARQVSRKAPTGHNRPPLEQEKAGVSLLNNDLSRDLTSPHQAFAGVSGSSDPQMAFETSENYCMSNPQSDVTESLQFSIPPMWNWQEMMILMSPGTGSEVMQSRGQTGDSQ
ncbi:fungal-specific transcription factor domain-containing protein [Penicillium digitatum]|uniref:Fungal-specific transcription factor domain-containing protein n=1 Tax=Penicillium digitatum TaxID=36651 RepID=A0A7T6XME5_PENDI|nr:fungal-specific transcription factor domain-containing protein [Penicillium digitatum]